MILVTFCFTSMFYFPFEFYFLPGKNVKMLMAALGIVVCAFYLIKRRSLILEKNLIPLFVLAGLVSVTGLFSMTYNGTIDDAYSGYIISMAVWLSAAFVVCNLIRFTHGEINIEFLCNYIIAVCVFQCITAIMIDTMPDFQKFVDTYINVDQKTLHELKRLYGIGANLDVAGTRFSACLIMITVQILRQKDYISPLKLISYFISFAIITVLGSMIARTTYVGVLLSVGYAGITIIIGASNSSGNLSKSAQRLTGYLLGIVAVSILFFTFEYNTNENIRHWLRFAFEGFFNLVENGSYSVASNEVLMDMYVFPETLKTWVIGDGYFSNPYWSDPNYIWQSQNIRGYYMGTDVGYLRFIFYFGVIGLMAFMVFLCKACATCIAKCKEYTMLFIFILLANFVIWLKVATDLFLVFALFICTVNMMPDEEDKDYPDETTDDLLITE